MQEVGKIYKLLLVAFFVALTGICFLCDSADAAVTYNAGTNELTVTGSPVSSTGKLGLTLWTADQANGWGVVTRCGTTCYCLDARLNIGAGTATFAQTTNESITFIEGSLVNDIHIYIDANAVLQSGVLTGTTNKTTQDGSRIWSEELTDDNNRLIVNSDPTSELRLYSSQLGRSYNDANDITYIDLTFGTANIYNTGFVSRCYLFGPNDVDMSNVYIQNVQYALVNPTEATTIDNLNISDATLAGLLALPGGSGTVVLENSSIYRAVNEVVPYTCTKNIYVRDCELENWSVTFVNPGASVVYRQYTLNIQVQTWSGTPIQGASVLIRDLTNALVFAGVTDVNGDITPTVLNNSYYLQAGAGVPTMTTPHTIQINYPGYLEYFDTIDIEDTYSFSIALTEDTVGYIGILNYLEDRTMEMILGLLCLVFFIAGATMKNQFLVIIGALFALINGAYWYSESGGTEGTVEYALFLAFMIALGLGGAVYFMTMRRSLQDKIDDTNDDIDAGEALEEKPSGFGRLRERQRQRKADWR